MKLASGSNKQTITSLESNNKPKISAPKLLISTKKQPKLVMMLSKTTT